MLVISDEAAAWEILSPRSQESRVQEQEVHRSLVRGTPPPMPVQHQRARGLTETSSSSPQPQQAQNLAQTRLDARPGSDTVKGGIMGQVKELQERMYAMEEDSGSEVHDQLEENLLRVEALIKEEVETLELQIEGKTSLGDLELLEEKVEQMDKLFEEEVEKHHQEVHDVNEVLKGLEELFETRDSEYAEERRHKIESHLRKSIFHMQRDHTVAAFNTWKEHVKTIKRQRHLTLVSIGQWKNRALARYFKPWAAMWRCEHKQQMEEAMSAIQSHHDMATQALEDRLHGLTSRIDQDLLTDEVLEEALKGIAAQLHEKEQELQAKMDQHAEHLHAKVDDGHGNINETIEAMESKFQQQSDGMVAQMDERVAELRDWHAANHSALGDKVDGNHEELVTWLGNKHHAGVESTIRSMLFRMQHKMMMKAWIAWLTDHKHAKYMRKHAEHEEAIAALREKVSPEELQKIVEAVEEHDVSLKRILKELGIKDINSYEAAGAVQTLIQTHMTETLTERDRERKEIHIEKLLRNVAIRWTHRDRSAAFNKWAHFAKKQKRQRNLAKKCIRRMDNLTVSRSFLPLLAAARALKDERTDSALAAYEERANQLMTDVTDTRLHLEGTMLEQRSKWIDMTLRRVLARWNKSLVASVFEMWAKKATHFAHVRQMMMKTIRIMDNQRVHHAFSPWLAAARQMKEEKLLAHTYEMHDEASARLEQLEKAQSHQQKSLSDQVVELRESITEIQSGTVQKDSDLEAQLAAIHGKLAELHETGDVEMMRRAIEERLEHLEVSLREEFQHVEVRCDIVSREFNRLCGKEWKDGLPPNKQPLDGLFAQESSAGRQLNELQQSMSALKSETSVMREVMRTQAGSAGGDSTPRGGGASGEELSSLRQTVHSMEGNIQRVFELKASLDVLQQQTDSARSKTEATSEAVAKMDGEMSGLKSQVESVATAVTAHEATGSAVAELKAGIHSVEREISAMRNEQQQRGVVDEGHSASIAGLKAELGSLVQAHTQAQHSTRDLGHKIEGTQSGVQVAEAKLKASEVKMRTLEQALATTKAEVADNASVLEANLTKVQQQVTAVAEECAQVAEKQDGIESGLREASVQAAEQAERTIMAEQAAADATAQMMEQQLPEEGDPPGAGGVIGELGNITRRIATLQMEQDVLSAEADDPEAAARLEEVVHELSALEGALDQLGIQAGMSPGTTPSEYGMDDGPYDDEDDDEYHGGGGGGGSQGGYSGYGDQSQGSVRQLSSRRRPDGLRTVRSRPTGAIDREAAWARAHAHAFGRASMQGDGS